MTILGLKADVITFPNWDKTNVVKTCVCRSPYNEALVGGLPNPLFHVNWGPFEEVKTEEEAKKIVYDAFIKWYHLEQYSA